MADNIDERLKDYALTRVLTDNHRKANDKDWWKRQTDADRKQAAKEILEDLEAMAEPSERITVTEGKQSVTIERSPAIPLDKIREYFNNS